jgi:hypothetical protein
VRADRFFFRWAGQKHVAHNTDAQSVTTELKRYSIKADKWEEFLGLWRRIVTVRKRVGFTVLFALVDRKNNVFTWAISAAGDFDAVAARYYTDPERIELESIGDCMTTWEITRVVPEPIP